MDIILCPIGTVFSVYPHRFPNTLARLVESDWEDPLDCSSLIERTPRMARGRKETDFNSAAYSEQAYQFLGGFYHDSTFPGKVAAAPLGTPRISVSSFTSLASRLSQKIISCEARSQDRLQKRRTREVSFIGGFNFRGKPISSEVPENTVLVRLGGSLYYLLPRGGFEKKNEPSCRKNCSWSFP